MSPLPTARRAVFPSSYGLAIDDTRRVTEPGVALTLADMWRECEHAAERLESAARHGNAAAAADWSCRLEYWSDLLEEATADGQRRADTAVIPDTEEG